MPQLGWTNTLPASLHPLYGLPCYDLSLGPGEKAVPLFGLMEDGSGVGGGGIGISNIGATTLATTLEADTEPDDDDYDVAEVDEDIHLPLRNNYIFFPIVNR